MALIGNLTRDSRMPLTFVGGSTLSNEFVNHNQQETRPSLFAGEGGLDTKSGFPDGGRHPAVMWWPLKPGALSTRGSIVGSGNASATGQSGHNIDATLTGTGGVDTSTSIGLIVSIAAALTASGGISSASTQALASMVATLTGSGSVAATAKGLADLGAALTGSGLVNANNTALMDVAAQIRGYGDLTPEGIRDSVWSALLANYTESGSAGLALSTASSGGVDPSILAAAVWNYATRSMPAAERDAFAAAILAAAQVTPIHSELIKVAGLTVEGAGIPPTFDENGVMTDPGAPLRLV